MRQAHSISLLAVLAFTGVAGIASANDVASSTMYFRGNLVDNGDGTFTGVAAMIDEGGAAAGYDIYAEEGATAWFGDDPGSGPVWTPQLIGADHDAWPTWTPDTPDWYQYSLNLYVDGTTQKWAVRNHAGATEDHPWDDVGHWGSAIPPMGVPMSGLMDWTTMFAAETDTGVYLPGTGTPEIPGGAAGQGGGPAAWDMDWSWGSEAVPLEFSGFDVVIASLGGGIYDITMTPAGPSDVWVDDDFNSSTPGWGATHFDSIQAAIDAVSGSTVHVAAGLYEEQVVIDIDDLTIIGAGSGDNPTVDTIILSPATLTYYYTTSANNYPIVGLDGVTGVTIQNLRVDGANRGTANYRFQGVGFWNSGGTLQDCVVANVMDTAFSGAQHGVGVYAYNDTGGPYIVNLTNVEVPDYQKGGIAMNGAGLTAHLTNCTTIGQGPTTVTAQNGIQFYGSSGSITDCYVEDNIYTGSGWAASGVLLIDGPSITMNDVDILDNDVNVYCQGTSCTATGLSVTNTDPDAGTGFYSRISSSGLPFPGGSEDLVAPASPYGDYSPPMESGGRGTMNVSVSSSTFVGDGTGYAISCSNYSATDTIVANAQNCTIDNWEWGFVVFDSASVNNVALTATYNALTNTLGGFFTYLPGQVGTNNWWGSPSGPDDPDGTVPADIHNCAPVGDIVNNNPYGAFVSDDYVEYCPWLGGSGTLELEVYYACLSDSQIQVELWMSDVSYLVTGFQAFLAYDDTVLTYNGALSSYNSAVFNDHFTDIDDAETAAGQLMLDGNDSSSVGTDQDMLLATLVFTVDTPCSTTEVEFDLTQDFDSELSYLGEPLASTLTDTIPFKLDSTPPVVTCGGDIEQSADAGDLTCHAEVIWLAPTAMDDCDGDVSGSLSYDIDLYSDMAVDATQTTTTYSFPVGVHTVTATAMDGCGNADSCSFTVTVNDVYDIWVDIQLIGNPNPVTRCIHFVVDDCTSVDVPISFIDHDNDTNTPVQATAAIVQVPCGTAWSMLCAKDEQHTKWASTYLFDSGAHYTLTAMLVLDGGDTDNDGDCDINDVTWYLAQVGSLANAGGCPWDGVTRDADFNNSGSVDNLADYTFLSRNWLTTSSCVCTLSLRRPTITVQPQQVERSTAGLPAEVARRADLNRDGRINFEDVMLFEAEHGLPATLSTKMWVSTEEAALQN
jgi:HYR domain